MQKVAYFRRATLSRPIAQQGDVRSRNRRGGTGEIEHIRKYIHGDEVRLIDRNVTARTGEYHVRIYKEELGMDLVILQDISSSMDFGIQNKRAVAIDVIAALVTAAQSDINKISLVPFSNVVEKKLSLSNSSKVAAAMLHHAIQIPPKQAVTNLSAAIAHLQQTQKRQALICIISDFVLLQFPSQALATLGKKHSLFAIHILDPLEISLPDSGWVRLQDPESRQELIWNLGNERKRRPLELFLQKKLRQIQTNICLTKAIYLQLVTSQNYLQKLWIYLSSINRFK